MYISDSVEPLDRILSSAGEVLEGSGTVRHAKQQERAKAEYKKYQVIPRRKEYLQTIKGLEKQAKTKSKRISKEHFLKND